ncbi:uncharacterized protein LOC111897275 isoform X1 [Lactuca sativa]|uniref:uncharacterized protein LOC111897275 isoform X1 n=1 Tax=Lactuca sativa TaxID=4236 RepID=UPI000CD9C486|nr:uncharacterized protein LOC111897275 isoform X1 [Lactuca sativa]
MDTVVYGALEEICSQGANGLTLRGLWSKIPTHLSSNGLHLCTNVKKALWSNLLNIPSLRFECEGVTYDAEDPKIQSFEDAEAIDLRIIAAEHLLNSFVGIYDIKASDAGISQPQRRALERLAIARTDGVTQNELVKEFGIKNNNMYYILRNLETRGLIVRQSTIVRKKEAGNDGEYKAGSIVNTNMLHLYRYAKPLGSLQRLEIIKENDADRRVVTGGGVSEEHIKEDVHIKDYLPAIKAVCDRLEQADGKVLVVGDIKKELGYRKTSGHRAWRSWSQILRRLKDAHLVEEFQATVNQKEVSCLRLLKTFSPKTFVPKSHGGGDDDLDTEQQVKLVNSGQNTEQLLELPIEQQIYDMIDAEGSKGLILNEVYKRLGIKNKRYYPRILDMVSRFQMHLESENLNRGLVYRVWTSGNFNSEASTSLPSKSEDTMDDKLSTQSQTQVGQLMLTHTTQESDHRITTVNAEASEEQNIDPIGLISTGSHNLQSDTSGIIVNLNPALEISSSASPASHVRRSYTTYPCLGFSSASSQREQRILEKLQEEKVLIKPELHRVLESLENLDNKHTMMDRKTLERSLNKLQEDGHCKCISFAIPSVTNCGRKRTVDVILHPSVYKAEDLSDIVHEKIRSFEKLIRTQCFPRHTNSKSKSIPVLNNVERIPTTNDVQSEAFIAMRENGFVLAKMVRAKLLHVFLWEYLTGVPGWDDSISILSGEEDDVNKNPYSSCKLFELDAAIKAMPLELFLQVAGSAVKLDSMIEKCRNGIRLSDLSIPEYRSLMETRATARISYVIDILRRLKLIRLIGGEFVEETHVGVGPHSTTTTTTTLRHSLELKPYIEEPVTVALPSPGVNSFDLRPHVRHDFVLACRKGVDEYWNTLEYCYSASDPKAALHAFPGSAVHEVFLSRSWASVRVMTAHQRAELLKLVANDDSNQKLSYKKCEKIAENLNLTLEQVLRVFYDKRQKNKLKGAGSTKDKSSNALITYKRKRSSKVKTVNNEKTLMENLLEESSKVKHPKLSHTHVSIDDMDVQKEAADDVALIEDEDDQPYSVSKLQQPTRTKRFPWTETADRLLVIEYVRHRATIGAKFHRAEWSSLENLPAPPETCRRRMSTLNRNNQFRKAVMRLCNMLSVRYAKHLEYSKNKTLIDNRKAPDVAVHPSNELDVDEQWDDFDKNDIKIALDEVLQYKQVFKIAATKGSSRFVSNNCPRQHEFDETNVGVGSSGNPSDEFLDSGRREGSGRRSRRRCLPKSYDKLMNRGKSFETQTYKSLAVSNAIELFKLIFLSTAKAPVVPSLLAETLRRYSEHDLFTAFNYLRDRKFMVRGNDASHFVLSQQFLHSISSSPFPVNTGKRAVKMSRWIHERENDLLEYGVNLPADLQCGDVLHLCLLMCSGEVSMFPCLPDEGVGEIEELKKRNRDSDDKQEQLRVEKAKKPKILDSEIFSRKEKGFPGIQLSLTRSLIPRIDAITFSEDRDTCPSVSNSSVLVASSESTWEGMSRHARHVASSGTFDPDMFKSVYSAIQKAGDQGLSMEGISEIIITDVQEGEKMEEVIVEVLEAFGKVLKVNAYDCVHVVDSLYRSKYLLASSMASHQHEHDLLHLKEPQTSSINDELQENRTSAPPDEEVHRVTILNHPQPEEEEQVAQVLIENEKEIVKVTSPRTTGTKEGFCIGDFDVDSPCYKPILPWVNGDGSINEIVYKGLVRRVLGIVMQNPGILEDHIITQMNVLNPQSCRKLLEVMILDSHIRVRKMYASVSNEPPAMLRGLFGCSFKKPKLVFRQHLFANPTSINCL